MAILETQSVKGSDVAPGSTNGFDKAASPSKLGSIDIQTVSISHPVSWTTQALGYLLDSAMLYLSRSHPRPNKDFLKGRFAPIDEETFKEELSVEGVIPPELDGVYLRTGPNPKLDPAGGYHWFDGDGMVHAARVKDGKVSYCNRYMQTYRLKKEQAKKYPLFVRLGDAEGWRGVAIMVVDGWRKRLGYLDNSQGTGTANTALVCHAGRIMSLNEGDLPYQVQVLCEGLLETMGRVKVGDWDSPFTAHPKVDKVTGILHFFGYNVSKQPYIQYGAVDPNGQLLCKVPIELPYPVMMHDFVITQNYAVLPHLPLVFEPKVMIEKGTLPFVFRPDLKSRFGVLPLCATDASELRWFEFPDAFMVIHFANAWEDGNKIKVFGCHMSNIDLNSTKIPDMKNTKDFGLMVEYTLDLDTGNTSWRRISTQTSGDFPVIAPHLCGRPSKYSYIAKHPSLENKDPTCYGGIAKLNLQVPEGEDGLVGAIEYPEGYTGGEAVFVPRYEDPSKCKGEDDGFLVVYLALIEAPHTSKFVVYDAATMSSTPLAVAQLPQRVPLGFHGTWVTGTELAAQKV